jgi:hypothetical protein
VAFERFAAVAPEEADDELATMVGAASLSSLALFAAMSATLSFSLVGFVGTLMTAEVLDLVGVR